jgi:hypothetical protein
MINAAAASKAGRRPTVAQPTANKTPILPKELYTLIKMHGSSEAIYNAVVWLNTVTLMTTGQL